MYVCICHAFTDKQVKKALEGGARTTAAVYRTLGHKVQCGKCVPYVRGMVEEHRQETFGTCAGGGNCGGCANHHDIPANDEPAVAYAIAAE
ncbi:(2Fe-2S)-binding protein [Azospirillum halopraeferens]|uniref:(2Fe-2S)-binding protein n=1 Tax=Azospirillum halopraeferens TaxID=34010 RepID=UPI000416544E|nr:(2Fe-2S)-binding protein [Azospirillum halopraeferens]